MVINLVIFFRICYFIFEKVNKKWIKPKKIKFEINIESINGSRWGLNIVLEIPSSNGFIWNGGVHVIIAEFENS
jgi:hypothetical protein